MTRARNLAGLSTVTAQPTVTTPVHLGPLGVVTATRYYGTFDETNIISTSIATTDIQISGITTGLNVSGIITAQNGLDITGNIVNGLNVSAGIATLQALTATTGTFTGDTTFAGTVSIAGTLTYEDITDIDSVGVGTFRKGIIVAGVGTFSSGVGIADSIFHTGDDNTAIRFPGADQFSVETAGSERLRITSDGITKFMGIRSGSLQPSDNDNLELYTKSTNADGDRGTGITFYNHDGSGSEMGGTIQVAKTNDTADNTSSYMRFGTRNNGSDVAERLRITSEGKVIIGDTNNDSLFAVSRASHQVAEFINTNADSTGAEIYLRKDSSSPADNDALGSLNFVGDNDNSEKINYAYIQGRSADVSDGTEDGNIRFFTRGAGTLAERVLLDNAGRLIIGHTTSTGQDRIFQIIGTTADTSSVEIRRHSADGSCPNIDFAKSRNATKGSNTIVNSGDALGQIVFRGDDGTDFTTPAATISASVDGTPGANDMPGRLEFSTTADGASSTTERLRISADGAIKFSGASYNMTWRYAASALRLDDDCQLNFGTDDDGDIYHDNSQMIINNATGILRVRCNEVRLCNTTNATYFTGISGGAAKLYHNDSVKLETTSAGVSVTGTVSDSKGDLRRVIENEPGGAAYQIVASDAGKFIHHNNTIKMPDSGTFSVGDMITIYAYGALTLDVTKPGGGEATVYNAADASTGDRTFAARSLGTLLCVAADTYVLSGAGIS